MRNLSGHLEAIPSLFVVSKSKKDYESPNQESFRILTQERRPTNLERRNFRRFETDILRDVRHRALFRSRKIENAYRAGIHFGVSFSIQINQCRFGIDGRSLVCPSWNAMNAVRGASAGQTIAN